jgi:hypothetical protein
MRCKKSAQNAIQIAQKRMANAKEFNAIFASIALAVSPQNAVKNLFRI